jgi:hypothetical protein
MYKWTLPSGRITSIPIGAKLGHFGDLSVQLKQQTPDGKPTPSQWRGVNTDIKKTPEVTTGSDPQTHTTTFVIYTSDVLWPEWNQKLYDPDVSDWNVLWDLNSVDSPEAGDDGVVRPYRPFNNRNAIRSFVTDQVTLFGRIGEDFTRYHFVDEHEATKQGNAALKGIPPGPDSSGKPFTQRWSEAKEKFEQDVKAIWMRCGDFSESVQITMYSELRSLEARAQFVHNPENYNAVWYPRATGEQGPPPYPLWNRLRSGAGHAGSQNDVITPVDPVLRLGFLGNVCDVTKVDVYAADVSFGEPTDVLIEGDLWRGFEGLRKTPHIRKYSLPCTVTFFTKKKTPTKVIETYRAAGDPRLEHNSHFSISSDTGDLYQKRPFAFGYGLGGGNSLGIDSYSVSFD